MKLSQLRPCDKCGGELVPVFYVVRACPAVIDQRATQSVLGVAGILGGLRRPGALGVAECLAPESDCVVVSGEKDPGLWSELFLCTECWAGTDVAGLAQAVSEKLAAGGERGG